MLLTHFGAEQLHLLELVLISHSCKSMEPHQFKTVLFWQEERLHIVTPDFNICVRPHALGCYTHNQLTLYLEAAVFPDRRQPK